MTFDEIVRARYAAKSFDPAKTLPPDKVDALLEVIRYAPTSFNVQPWRVMVIADAERKERLLAASWNQPQVTSCSHHLVFCANVDLDPLVQRLKERSLAAGLPAAKVEGFLGMVRGFIAALDDRERLAWAQRQAYIALANGMNGATALGFDACPMEGIVPAMYSEILGLPETLVPTVGLACGYATDEPRPKLRFTRDEMFFERV